MTTDVQPSRSRSRIWLIAAIVAWGVLLAAAGAYGARYGRPTVAEQTTIVEAVPTLNRVVAEVATAGIAAGAVATVSGYVQTDGSCRIAPGRSGERWERTATLYAVPGTEGELLDAVVAATPKAWKLRVRRSSAGAHRITGDAGSYVRVAGAVSGPGQVRVGAQTGCRERGGALPGPPAAGTANRTPVEQALTRLGMPAAEWHEHRVDCPGGGTLWTVEATAPHDGSVLLSDVLRDTPDVVFSTADLHVWREGGTGLVARVGIDRVAVLATTPC